MEGEGPIALTPVIGVVSGLFGHCADWCGTARQGLSFFLLKSSQIAFLQSGAQSNPQDRVKRLPILNICLDSLPPGSDWGFLQSS